MDVYFCGTRGSMPAPGEPYVRYGGHTSCVGLARAGEQPSLVLDAGTGLVNLDAVLGPAAFRGTLLLGHLHWDHTQGMPFFAAGTRPGHRVAVLLPAQGQGQDAELVLARTMSPPHFPIEPHALGEGWRFGSIEEGEHEIEGFSVLAREIPHKGDAPSATGSATAPMRSPTSLITIRSRSGPARPAWASCTRPPSPWPRTLTC